MGEERERRVNLGSCGDSTMEKICADSEIACWVGSGGELAECNADGCHGGGAGRRAGQRPATVIP